MPASRAALVLCSLVHIPDTTSTTVFDQRVIDVGPICLGKDASRPIAAVLSGGGLLSPAPLRMSPAWLDGRTIDATQTDALRVLLVQDIQSIAVKNGDDEARVIGRKIGTGEKEIKDCGQDNTLCAGLLREPLVRCFKASSSQRAVSLKRGGAGGGAMRLGGGEFRARAMPPLLRSPSGPSP